MCHDRVVSPVSSPQYYDNTTSSAGMEDVLVVTLPQRNYSLDSGMPYNDTVRETHCLSSCLSVGLQGLPVSTDCPLAFLSVYV